MGGFVFMLFGMGNLYDMLVFVLFGVILMWVFVFDGLVCIFRID